MGNRTKSIGGWCAVVGLLSTLAGAQEFELDLSEESTTEAVPAELRPSLAVLEVVAGDGEGVSAGRARQLESELLEALGKLELFQPVLPPAEAKTRAADVPFSCGDLDCFKALNAKLKVHRLARLTVQRQGAGSLVTLVAFDPAVPGELTRVAIDSAERAEKTFMGVAGRTQAQRDRDFLRKVVPQLRSAFRKLATANAKIVIDNRDPAVTVLIDGQPVGTGRVEAVVHRGDHTVSIDGTLYEPFRQPVTVKPLETVNVEVRLVAKPLARPVVTQKDTGVPLGARPGLYLAIAGVAAAAVGVGLGVTTQGVQQRIDAGGSPVGVTRAEALSASTNAVLANVLIAGGAALAAGGILWVALTPSGQAGSTAGEPTDSPGPSGMTLWLGGTF